MSYDNFISCIEIKIKKKVEPFNLKEVYLDILRRSNNYEDINLEIENLVKNYDDKNTSLNENELIILKNIYACVKDVLTFDEFIKSLEEKELSFKKTGKIFRNIIVNFHSKLPIESIIKFFGTQKVINMISQSINNE